MEKSTTFDNLPYYTNKKGRNNSVNVGRLVSFVLWVIGVTSLFTFFIIYSPNPFSYKSKEKQHPLAKNYSAFYEWSLKNISVPYQNNSLEINPPNNHLRNPLDNSFIVSQNDVNQTAVMAINPQKESDVEKKCDLFKGRWIPDLDGSLYTNWSCPTMPSSKNCRKHGRKDVDYMNWRWKPNGCELPRFNPKTFLSVVRGKKFAFIGDSVARNQMESLLCLLSQGETPKDIYKDSEDRFRTFYFPSHNFTLMVYWVRFLVVAEERGINGTTKTDVFDIHLDKIDINWAQRLRDLDYAVISDAHWYFRKNYLYEGGRQIGCIYCNEPNVPDLGVPFAVGKAFGSVLEYINDCKECNKGLVTLLRTFSPAHFEHGSWRGGGTCNRTSPYTEEQVKLASTEMDVRSVQVKEFEKIKKRTKGKRFEILDITRAMMMRPDGHPDLHWDNQYMKGHSDCVHWCLPGPIDIWNDLLMAVLQKEDGHSASTWFILSALGATSIYVLFIFYSLNPFDLNTSSLIINSGKGKSAFHSSYYNVTEKNKCDLFKGHWVPDRTRPLYTNWSCPTLPDSKNCAKHGRKDVDYLNWRWKPQECELPRFDSKIFLSILRSKRLAFVGDSVARNHMESLLCLLYQVSAAFSSSFSSFSCFCSSSWFNNCYIRQFNIAKCAAHFSCILIYPTLQCVCPPSFTTFGWISNVILQDQTPMESYRGFEDRDITFYFPAYDFTLVVFWANTLVLANERVANGSKTGVFDLHLDKADHYWAIVLPALDYVIISDAHWFFRKSYLYEGGELIGCIYCDESNVTQLNVPFAIGKAFRSALEYINDCEECNGLVTLLRTFSPSHFENGFWNTGGYCNRTSPNSEEQVNFKGYEWELRNSQVKEIERIRNISEKRGNKKRYEIVDITRAMIMRPDGHPGSYWNNKNAHGYDDCAHWCLPGPIDVWNDLLMAVLQKMDASSHG
ncbi:hypothetical protein MKX01_024193 [Papaver californicum]|nr:hypothetical protein MKX01_024193 [Papaver californicum]